MTHGSTSTIPMSMDALAVASDRDTNGTWPVADQAGSGSTDGIGALHPGSTHMLVTGPGTPTQSLSTMTRIIPDGISPITRGSVFMCTSSIWDKPALIHDGAEFRSKYSA
jgi:hypothetical protein